jgi:two-component system alkaline phosphatase synthesis response regulator PhoP
MPEPTAAATTARPRVLVVDDNAQNVELIVAYLESLDVETLTAGDGVEGLEKIRASHPDLVLLDVMMPRMSGFEVCRQMKADPELRDTPVIMVTALNEFGDIERAAQSGTNDFLTKPVNKLELITRVKTLLRLRHLKEGTERTLAYLMDMEGQTTPAEKTE